MVQVKFQLKTAGYCVSGRHIALRGAKREEIPFPGTYGLIEHPEHGHILFDTGYTRRFYQETKHFPGKIYAWITPSFVKEEEEAAIELHRMGISPTDVRHVIVSHFHADHVAGLKDFPSATIYCSEAACEQAVGLKGYAALSKGILPGLLPIDLEKRVFCIENNDFPRVNDPDLGPLVDLFGDGSILLASLPGHAKGQIGALLNTEKGKVFLVADACWLKETYESGWLPSPIVRLLFDSWLDFKQSLERLRNYIKRHPETVIIPCHCEETRQSIMQAS